MPLPVYASGSGVRSGCWPTRRYMSICLGHSSRLTEEGGVESHCTGVPPSEPAAMVLAALREPRLSAATGGNALARPRIRGVARDALRHAAEHRSTEPSLEVAWLPSLTASSVSGRGLLPARVLGLLAQ